MPTPVGRPLPQPLYVVYLHTGLVNAMETPVEVGVHLPSHPHYNFWLLRLPHGRFVSLQTTNDNICPLNALPWESVSRAGAEWECKYMGHRVAT